MKICQVNFNDGAFQPFLKEAQNIIKKNPKTKAENALTALSVKGSLAYKNVTAIAGSK